MLLHNSRFFGVRSAPLAAMLVIAFAASFASAQAQTHLTRLYQAKLTCGFNPGQVPLLNDRNPFPHHWENFKPGNYATSLNITNSTLQSQTFYAYISLTDYPSFPFIFLGSVSLPLFGTLEVGCAELSPAFPPTTQPGQFVDAVLHLFSTGNHFTVKAVYTYSSRDAFERHLFVGLDKNDDVGVLEAHGSGVSTVPAEDPLLVPVHLAASGAGGLGLGASVDHEDITPRTISILIPSLDERATRHPENLLTANRQHLEGFNGNN